MHQTMDNKQQTYFVSKLLMVNDQHNLFLTHDEFFKLSVDIGYQVPNNMDFFFHNVCAFESVEDKIHLMITLLVWG